MRKRFISYPPAIPNYFPDERQTIFFVLPGNTELAWDFRVRTNWWRSITIESHRSLPETINNGQQRTGLNPSRSYLLVRRELPCLYPLRPSLKESPPRTQPSQRVSTQKLGNSKRLPHETSSLNSPTKTAIVIGRFAHLTLILPCTSSAGHIATIGIVSGKASPLQASSKRPVVPTELPYPFS